MNVQQQTLVNRARLLISEELFKVRPWSILINPFFIARSGLYRSIKRISPQITGTVLDFGCGSKPYETLFTNASLYIGIDVELSGHNHASSKVDKFFEGNVIPFEDNYFDSVVCFEVFEHLFDLKATLLEINRVLKPGGKLLVTVPFAWDEHEQPFDFARYTSFGLSHLLKGANFTIIDFSKTNDFIKAIGQMIIVYLSQRVFPKNLFGAAVTQVLFIFPISIMTLVLSKLLPKRFEYYSNNVVLAEQKSN